MFYVEQKKGTDGLAPSFVVCVAGQIRGLSKGPLCLFAVPFSVLTLVQEAKKREET
jgi:hypothetical protein